MYLNPTQGHFLCMFVPGVPMKKRWFTKYRICLRNNHLPPVSLGTSDKYCVFYICILYLSTETQKKYITKCRYQIFKWKW